MVSKLEQSLIDEQRQLDELTNKPEEKESEKLVDEVIDDDKEGVVEPGNEEPGKVESEEEKQKRENDLRAKERISKKESRKKLELENAQLKGYVAATQEMTNKAQSQSKQEAAIDAEPDGDLDPDAHLRWELRQERAERLKDKRELEQMKLQNQMNEGKAELRAIEDVFKSADPDYESAKQYLIQGTYDQVKAENPGVSEIVIRKEIERREILEAARATKMGYDPAMHFKMLAIRNGWKAEVKSSQKEEKLESKPKIDLKSLELNKKKTASLIGGSSRGKVGDPSTEDVVSMTIRDMAKLEDSYWKRV